MGTDPVLNFPASETLDTASLIICAVPNGGVFFTIMRVLTNEPSFEDKQEIRLSLSIYITTVSSWLIVLYNG